MAKVTIEKPEQFKKLNINLLLLALIALSLALNIYFFWFAYSYKNTSKFDLTIDRFFFATSGKRLCNDLKAKNWFDTHLRAKDTCALIEEEF